MPSPVIILLPYKTSPELIFITKDIIKTLLRYYHFSLSLPVIFLHHVVHHSFSQVFVNFACKNFFFSKNKISKKRVGNNRETMRVSLGWMYWINYWIVLKASDLPASDGVPPPGCSGADSCNLQVLLSYQVATTPGRSVNAKTLT